MVIPFTLKPGLYTQEQIDEMAEKIGTTYGAMCAVRFEHLFKNAGNGYFSMTEPAENIEAVILGTGTMTPIAEMDLLKDIKKFSNIFKKYPRTDAIVSTIDNINYIIIIDDKTKHHLRLAWNDDTILCIDGRNFATVTLMSKRIRLNEYGTLGLFNDLRSYGIIPSYDSADWEEAEIKYGNVNTFYVSENDFPTIMKYVGKKWFESGTIRFVTHHPTEETPE